MSELTRTLAARWHALAVHAHQKLETARHDERGSITVQETLWAIAGISFVGLIAGVIMVYLSGKAALIG